MTATDNHAVCPVCQATEFHRRAPFRAPEVRVCANCKLAYSHPLQKGDEENVSDAESSVTSSSYYENIVRDYELQSAKAKPKAIKLLRYWTSQLRRAPESILEIGCGTGQYSSAWRELGIDWTGAEINPLMIQFCQDRGMHVSHFNEIIKSKQSYDIVFLSQVLEHNLDPNEFLQTVLALLSPDGLIQIDVPNHNSLTSTIRKLNFINHDYGFIQSDHHQIAYTAKALKTLLELNGLEIIHLASYANNHSTFGQLTVYKSLARRSLLWISAITNLGSLLVAVARKKQT